MSTTQITTNNVSPVNVEVADKISAPTTLTRLTTKTDQNDDVAGKQLLHTESSETMSIFFKFTDVESSQDREDEDAGDGGDVGKKKS